MPSYVLALVKIVRNSRVTYARCRRKLQKEKNRMRTLVSHGRSWETHISGNYGPVRSINQRMNMLQALLR